MNVDGHRKPKRWAI